jgi:hypothetical protein
MPLALPEPVHLRFGEAPPELAIGDGDPEAIRAQGVEITDLAGRVAGDRQPLPLCLRYIR